MNYSQQSNISIKYTSVTIVNVEFKLIVIDSNINTLLNELQVTFSELDKLISLDMSINDIKLKGIKINSLIETLMEATSDVDYQNRNSFIKNLIGSSVAIVNKYEYGAKLEGFGDELRNDLVAECRKYFEKYFGRFLNGEFWWNLKFYEWLKKEDFIYLERHYGQRNIEPYFKHEDLEKFFYEDRNNIIKRMLDCERFGSKLKIQNPLSDSNMEYYFESFKMLPN